MSSSNHFSTSALRSPTIYWWQGVLRARGAECCCPIHSCLRAIYELRFGRLDVCCTMELSLQHLVLACVCSRIHKVCLRAPLSTLHQIGQIGQIIHIQRTENPMPQFLLLMLLQMLQVPVISIIDEYLSYFHIIITFTGRKNFDCNKNNDTYSKTKNICQHIYLKLKS